jgi:hypothetical protein
MSRSIYDLMRQAQAEVEREREIRKEIERLRQNGRDDNGERLRKLAKEHHQLTGTGGRAI